MDLLVLYCLSAFSGLAFAASLNELQMVGIVLFVIAGCAAGAHRVGIISVFYLIALIPLAIASIDYTSSVVFSLAVYVAVCFTNIVVMSAAFCLKREYWPMSVPVGVAVLALPPLATLGLANHVPLAGIMFPGLGYLGLALFGILVASLVSNKKLLVIPLAFLSVVVNASAEDNDREESIVEGIDTTNGVRSGSLEASAYHLMDMHYLVDIANDVDKSVVVFPESAYGNWQDGISEIMEYSSSTVLGGARIWLNDEQYVNALVNGKTGHVEYAQQYPIPIKLDHAANAVSGNSVVAAESDYSVLICNEITNVFHSVRTFGESDADVIWIANFGWSGNEWTARRVKTIAVAYSDLFGVNLVTALNT